MLRKVIFGVALAATVAGLGTSARPAGSARDAFFGINGRIVVQATKAGGFGAANLYVYNPEKRGLIALTRDNAHNANPAWSPDGKRIAYNSNLLGTGEADQDIWVIGQDASNARRLTSGRSVDTDPSWSPDGRRIAFESDRGGTIDIWAVDAADGGNASQLTSAAGADEDPAWSPDGSKVAFVSTRDGNREIYVMSADGTGAARLTTNGAGDRHPSWSPDGRRIAFDSDRSGNFEIYTMAADGSDVVKMTQHPAVDSRPAYSPDGNYLVFQSERDSKGARQIFVIPTQGGTVGQAEQTRWWWSTWATSPDWQRQLTKDPCDVRGTIYADDLSSNDGTRGTICGLGGNDHIDIWGGNGTVRGGAGNDLIHDYGGTNRIYGDAGNDRIYSRDGRRDVIDGGPGRDVVQADKIDRLVRVERRLR